jgi:hypothetical protein
VSGARKGIVVFQESLKRNAYSSADYNFMSTSPGKEFRSAAGATCYCKMITDPNAVKEVVIFKYLPRSLLIAKDLISSDGDVELDEEEIQQRVARIRRRAREEIDDLRRNQRVSLECSTLRYTVLIIFTTYIGQARRYGQKRKDYY